MAMGRLQTSGRWDAQSSRWLQESLPFMNWENHKQLCLRSDIFPAHLRPGICKHRKPFDCSGEARIKDCRERRQTKCLVSEDVKKNEVIQLSGCAVWFARE